MSDMFATITLASITAYSEMFGYDIVVNGDKNMFDLYFEGRYIYSRRIT